MRAETCFTSMEYSDRQVLAMSEVNYWALERTSFSIRAEGFVSPTRVAAAMAEAEASRVRNGYNSNGSGPRPAQTARECSYSEFLKCKPLDFKGTEGVVRLTRWFEKMESVFSISNYDALTWWNAHVKTYKTSTPEANHCHANGQHLKKMLSDKYCQRETGKEKKGLNDLSKNSHNQLQQNTRPEHRAQASICRQ
ncbi:hypothetical protein Tco_0750650 [Tanacetum coccineum]|uniref:Reverse transcriptase domain-containing protein n=1 Tax=Tanacetum coccineum TaxID=301880 RepID=A0ABQ4Z1U4_9ASTR